MSIYKIIFGQDMAPQNKNTSHLKEKKKWEEFFESRDFLLPDFPSSIMVQFLFIKKIWELFLS